MADTWEKEMEELDKHFQSMKLKEREKIKKAMLSFGLDAKEFWIWYEMKHPIK